MLSIVPWFVFAVACVSIPILIALVFRPTDRDRPLSRLVVSVTLGLAALVFVAAGALFAGPHLTGTFPPVDASRFELVELTGDPAKDKVRLDGLDQSFELVTTIEPEKGRKSLLFRRGQLSHFQKTLATNSARSFALGAASLLVSLVGVVALFWTVASLRAAAYSQVYSRYQGLLQSVAQYPGVYRLHLGGPAVVAGHPPVGTPTAQAGDDEVRLRLFRASLLSLFEEIYLLRHSTLFPLLPMRAWKFWEGFLSDSLHRGLHDYIDRHPQNFDTGFVDHCRHLFATRPAPGSTTAGT